MQAISAGTARRLALAAQGFGADRYGARVPAGQLRAMLDQISVLQLDSVNVLCRSHYLPLFARLGAYSRNELDDLAWSADRALFEYWVHRASLARLALFPLFRWRMEAARAHVWDRDIRNWRQSSDPALHVGPSAIIEGMTRISAERPRLLDEVRTLVDDHGPLTAAEAESNSPAGAGEGGRMWNWNDAKIALEWLFFAGEITVAGRRGFERVYDLTERVLPAAVVKGPAPDRETAQRELLKLSVAAQGIATEKQLREYFHLPVSDTRQRISELLESGALVPAVLEGSKRRTYLAPEVPEPAEPQARALLSPFDSLIWNRDRTEELFDFHYRISIYTPAAQRVHGYYVLPFLLGDRLVARVDVKADRRRSALVVPSAHGEPEIDRAEVSRALAAELRLLADWLELDEVTVQRSGDLGAPLSKAMASIGA
ncbi:winged helix-turn-helix domain-containing protein [Kribbella albertanoniae]